MANEPVSPALKVAPPKQGPTLDAAKYAEEIRARRGDGIRMMEGRLSLKTKAPEGWYWRWFNDVDSNVQNALDDGWRFVTPDRAEMSQSVGRGNDSVADRVTKITSLGDGRPIQVHLMEIPHEVFEEIKEARTLAPVRAFEAAINRGEPIGVSGSHIYNPGEDSRSSFHKAIHNHIGPDDRRSF